MSMDDLPDTPTDARPDPRWRRRKEARPGEILRAALDIFLERGYKAARLEDIARSAGCTKGTIFLYYAGKAELFKAAVLEAMVPILESAEQSFADHQFGHAAMMIRAELRGSSWQRVRTAHDPYADPLVCPAALADLEAARDDRRRAR